MAEVDQRRGDGLDERCRAADEDPRSVSRWERPTRQLVAVDPAGLPPPVRRDLSGEGDRCLRAEDVAQITSACVLASTAAHGRRLSCDGGGRPLQELCDRLPPGPSCTDAVRARHRPGLQPPTTHVPRWDRALQESSRRTSRRGRAPHRRGALHGQLQLGNLGGEAFISAWTRSRPRRDRPTTAGGRCPGQPGTRAIGTAVSPADSPG